MTTRREWFSLLAAVLAVFLTAKAFGADGSWAVFAPDGAADSASTRLSQLLGLDPGSLYIFRAGSAEPRRISISGVWHLHAVSASPATGLIAVNAVLPPRPTGPRLAAFVVDTTGRQRRRFEEARQAEWSPDGSKLALWFASENPDTYPNPESVGVWESASDRLRIYHVHPYMIGWWTNDVVLLDSWFRTDALDLRDGSVRQTSIRGQIASPDTLFSISNRYETGAQAWDERTRTEMTSGIEGLLEGGGLRGFPDPFWIPSSRTGHLLCVSACRYRDSMPPTCNVYVIDPKAGVVVRKIPGKGIGPTADRRGIVTLRGTTIRFVPLIQD